MKKLILLSLLVVGLLIISGCTQEQLTQEEKEILGEDGALAGQATYDKAKLNECRRDKQCWSDLLSCYRAECPRAKDKGACINSCLDRAMGTSESSCETELGEANQKIAELQSQLSSCQQCNDISCGTDIFKDDVFSSGCTQFQYKGADAMTKTQPIIKFKNIATGETVESRLELRALARTIHEGVRYHFWSDSDYNVDDFMINLVSPCDNDGTACLTEINHRDEFVIGGDTFQYMGADNVAKTEPKIKFKNLETGESLEIDLRLVAVSHILYNGRRHHFESDSGADYNVDDFRISLFHPCS